MLTQIDVGSVSPRALVGAPLTILVNRAVTGAE